MVLECRYTHDFPHWQTVFPAPAPPQTKFSLLIILCRDADQLLAADKAFRAMLDACIKAGDKCALSHVNSTAIELETTLRVLAEDYRRAPVAVGDSVISYEVVLGLYYIVLKYPSDVGTAAVLINNLLTRENLTAVAEYYAALNAAIALGGEALPAIKCGDSFPRSAELAGVIPEVEYMKQTSSLFGLATVGYAMQCARWPFEAKERYSGDFKVKTKTPALFIGNTYDPSTPAASAQNMSASFEGSRMLEQNGFGVSFSFKTPPYFLSLCLLLIPIESMPL